jgi:hypothetical protein
MVFMAVECRSVAEILGKAIARMTAGNQIRPRIRIVKCSAKPETCLLADFALLLDDGNPKSQ